jgi:Effector-associated domain 1
VPTAQHFYDARLRGGGLAQLAKLLSSIIRDQATIKIVVDEAGFDVGEIVPPDLRARDQWTAVIRAVDAEKDGLSQLLREVRSRAGSNDIERLDIWSARGSRSEHLADAAAEIVSGARSVASLGNPRHPQMGDVLKALRGAAQDLAEGLADQELGDSFLMRYDDDVQIARAHCIAAARRARTAADALAVGIQRAADLAATAPRNQALDLTFTQQRSIDAALFDDQEAVEASLDALIAELRKYTVSLLPENIPSSREH